MDKLVEYSDDDDEVAAVKTSVDEEAEETKVASDKVGAKSDGVSRGEIDPIASSSRKEGNGRDSADSHDPDESSILRLLGPPAKVMHSRRSKDDESGSSGGAGSLEKETVTDPEWGLGIEKPSDNVDEELYKKLAHFHTLKKEQGTHFNQSLNRNRSFHNPHIYSKLVQWVEVEETGSAYSDMIKGGKAKADSIWPSSSEARKDLRLQGGKDVISSLQRKRQEESDERKKKSRRDNLDFVGASTPSSPAPGHKHSATSSSSRSHSEALALAESRARRIRDDLVAGRHTASDDRDRYRRRDVERESSRSSHHQHHTRRP